MIELTINEIIDKIKYHGHCYGYSMLEILEYLKSNFENTLEENESELIKDFESELEQKLENQKEEINERINALFDTFLEEIENESEDMIKSFPNNQAKILIESDTKRQILMKFINEINRMD